MPLVISTKGFPLKNPISFSLSGDSFCDSLTGVASLEYLGRIPQSSLGLSRRLGNVSTLMSRIFR